MRTIIVILNGGSILLVPLSYTLTGFQNIRWVSGSSSCLLVG